MSSTPALVVAVVVSVAGAVGINQWLSSSGPADSAAVAATPDQLTALRQRIEAQSEALAALETKLSSAKASPSGVRSAEGLSVDQVKALIAKALAGRAGSGAAEASAKPKVSLAAAIQRLTDENKGWDDMTAAFGEYHAAGMMDEVIAELERIAEANPNSARHQTLVGTAYIQALMKSDDMLEQGQLAQKADGAFDRALKLDPENWTARFTKASSYSHWPAITGKPAQAVKHFQTLVQQQEASGRRDPKFAQTYVLLGNLLNQQGKGDEARAMWERGRRSFPNDAALREALK